LRVFLLILSSQFAKLFFLKHIKHSLL